jgi:hypothetical protein
VHFNQLDLKFLGRLTGSRKLSIFNDKNKPGFHTQFPIIINLPFPFLE